MRSRAKSTRRSDNCTSSSTRGFSDKKRATAGTTNARPKLPGAATRSAPVKPASCGSTSTAAKKALLFCVQSTTRTGTSPSTRRISRPNWVARSGSMVVTSIWLTISGMRNNTCAASRGMKTKLVSASLKPT